MNLQLFASERTEEATPKRKQDARGRGQIFKSTELTSAATLLSTYLVLKAIGPYMAGRVVSFSRSLWEQGPLQDWSESGVRMLLLKTLFVTALVAAPVLLAAVVTGIAANVLQVGFLFTLEPIVPQFDRVNPGSGLKRLFSTRALVELIKALLKMGLIAYIGYRTIAGDLDRFPGLLGLEINQVVIFLTNLVSRLLLWVGISMLVMALADYLYQRWDYEKSLRMSKQEVKEEFKQSDGNPEIRSKIRQKQRELARGRMMQDVKKADVVVTNPTHFAVALEYKPEQMGAPRVLAKGQGFVALRIRELAKESNVPIIENKPLARELHRVVDVGQEVPGDLYQAVAEVLAFVYQLKQKGF